MSTHLGNYGLRKQSHTPKLFLQNLIQFSYNLVHNICLTSSIPEVHKMKEMQEHRGNYLLKVLKKK